MSHYHTVIIRRNMVAEVWIAQYLKHHGLVSQIMETDQQTALNEEQLASIRGHKILIVGAYYRDNIEPIIQAIGGERQLTWILYSSEDLPGMCYSNSICFCATEIAKKAGVAITAVDEQIAHLLDQHANGKFGDADCMNFQRGIYMRPGSNTKERLATITTGGDIRDTIEQGRVAREPLIATATHRAKTSVGIQYRAVPGSDTITLQCAAGDAPIVESCVALAEKSPSGVGMLVRQEYSTNITRISIYSNDPLIGADDLARELVGGGGTRNMAGGQIQGLFTAQQLVDKVNVVEHRVLYTANADA